MRLPHSSFITVVGKAPADCRSGSSCWLEQGTPNTQWGTTFGNRGQVGGYIKSTTWWVFLSILMNLEKREICHYKDTMIIVRKCGEFPSMRIKCHPFLNLFRYSNIDIQNLSVSKYSFSSNSFKNKDYPGNLRKYPSLLWCQSLHRSPKQLIKVKKMFKRGLRDSHIGQTQPFP